MVGFPTPPAPAAPLILRSFARLFGRGAQPAVSATLLRSSLELVNEGDGVAFGLVCVVAGARRLEAGTLAPGATATVDVGPVAEGEFRCVWTCLDARGRRHVWSYDGRHQRRRRPVDATAAYAALYGDGR